MADFITIDISSIFNNQKPTESKPAKNGAEKATETTQKPAQKKSTARVDWSKELQKRLNDNKALDKESRVSDYDIEAQFWKDFFNANWPENVAEILDKVIGEQLKKDIKVLGFKKQTNPIIAFLSLKYVQNNLIITKLINNNTYKAIHNAVANHYVADSEFYKDNNYNIIYCADLYATRSSSEIESYLKTQKMILPTNIREYTVERQDRNKSIFLEVGKKSVKQKGVKLKGLAEIQKLTGTVDEASATDNEKNNPEATNNEEDTTIKLDSKELVAFIGKSPAKAAATLQFIGLTSKHPKAFNELKKLKNISMEALAAASSEIASKFSKVKMDTKSADTYIKVIVNNVIPYL